MAKPIEDCVVLYVEDDDATAYLFQVALRESGLQPQVFRVRDGEEALAILAQDGPHRTAPSPDLVLLDLNLPKHSGVEILKIIRQDTRWRDLPVYVFSTSGDPVDRDSAEQAGATGYLRKGDTFDAFVAAARTVCASLC